MKPFEKTSTIAVPFEKADVDTDQIVPKQFLKSVKKTGFGKFLFFNWRYDQNGDPNPEFVLNDPAYKNSKILITGDNFGCGSSREHAVWALQDHGFAVIIAPSFADIFYSNCFKNGILPIILPKGMVKQLQNITSKITIDLKEQTITADSHMIQFEIEPYRKKILLEGLDDIAQTMQYENKISSNPSRRQLWVWFIKGACGMGITRSWICSNHCSVICRYFLQ